MKKIAVLSLLLFLLAASVSPALAGKSTNVVMNGTITAIDSANKTITITTVSGPFPKGSEVVVYTTSRTRFLQQIADGTCIYITFEDLEVGDLVGVTGRFENGLFVATRITVKL